MAWTNPVSCRLAGYSEIWKERDQKVGDKRSEELMWVNHLDAECEHIVNVHQRHLLLRKLLGSRWAGRLL